MRDHWREVRRAPRILIPYVILAVLTLGAGATAWVSSRPIATLVGPEGVVVYNVPDIAPAATTLPGAPVDAITCRTESKESVKYHTHTHVAIYVNGQMMRLPAGIGITQPQLIEHLATGEFYDVGGYDCLYWLHTHVADGIIHVEAPAKKVFTLGEFFDVWHQPLSSSRVATRVGKVVVFENGKRLNADPRLTPLLNQGDIQIDIGNPVVAVQPFRFKVTGSCGEGTLSCSIPKG